MLVMQGKHLEKHTHPMLCTTSCCVGHGVQAFTLCLYTPMLSACLLLQTIF